MRLIFGTLPAGVLAHLVRSKPLPVAIDKLQAAANQIVQDELLLAGHTRLGPASRGEKVSSVMFPLRSELIRAVAFAGGLVGCLCPMTAQSGEELVNKHIAARGGMDNFRAITSIRMSGTLEVQGTDLQFNVEAKPDSLVRQTLTLQGMAQVQAYDGSEAWQIDPFGGRRDPERMGEDDTRDLIETYDFYGPLVDHQRKGSRVEYLGHSFVDGDDALLLKVTLRNGDIWKCYLDPDTLLEIRRERQMFVRGKVHQSFENLGSYKKVNGVYFPFSIDSGTPGDPASANKLTISTIEANTPIPDSEFRMPKDSAGNHAAASIQTQRPGSLHTALAASGSSR